MAENSRKNEFFERESIAIIAILAGMLLPALSSARERGRSASCINILKQYALANLMYADDNEVLCPVAAGSIYYYGTRNGSHGSFTYDFEKGGFLHAYTSANAMLCPTFGMAKGIYKAADADQVGGIGYNRLTWSGTTGSTDKSISNGLTKPGSIKRASEIVMFGDTAMFAGGDFSGTAYLVPNGVGMADDTGTVHFRHNNMANIAWCDGHVSAVRAKVKTAVNTGHFEDSYRHFWSDWTEESPTP